MEGEKEDPIMSKVRVNTLLFGIKELKKHYFDIQYPEGIPKEILDKLREIQLEAQKLIEIYNTCPHCQGEGMRYDYTVPTPMGFLKTVCDFCDGTGEI